MLKHCATPEQGPSRWGKKQVPRLRFLALVGPEIPARDDKEAADLDPSWPTAAGDRP